MKLASFSYHFDVNIEGLDTNPKRFDVCVHDVPNVGLKNFRVTL